ncbi:hypothetical protein C2G38_2079175 [Gigaspora rosea]|uniref:Uncharacterized protein n=1 Tax=Gigaspora rosea TaxID=44941 RepID=A0A397VGY1_9GLOM|nr:hypothetical protein C2G38_2079175 [Gigaspora rosea]
MKNANALKSLTCGVVILRKSVVIPLELVVNSSFTTVFEIINIYIYFLSNVDLYFDRYLFKYITSI